MDHDISVRCDKCGYYLFVPPTESVQSWLSKHKERCGQTPREVLHVADDGEGCGDEEGDD